MESFVEIAPRTDVIGALTEYSVSYIKPADFNVSEKLNEFSLCVTARVCSSRLVRLENKSNGTKQFTFYIGGEGSEPL